MAKVLVTNPFPSHYLQELQNFGLEVTHKTNLSHEELLKIIPNFSILLCNLTEITEDVINLGTKLNIIIRCGTGPGKIDIKAASKRGIIVCDTPNMCDDAIAELTLAHILACSRSIVQNTDHLRRGEWRQKFFMNCNGLSGRVAGLIGTGNAARTLIKHLQSMNMKIKVWDKIDSSSSNNIQGVEYVTDLNDIAKTCDVISVHIDNSNNSNYHLINKTFFDFVQEDSIFVNTSCASVVDTQALMGAVEEKYLLVGLDTYDEEPIATNADFSLTEVAEIASSATCHIASYTKQSFEMIAKEATKIVVNFVKYGKILNQINSAIVNQQMKNITLMIRHSDALGKIVNCCTENKINIVEIKNSNLTENEDIQNCLLTIDENQIDFQETIGKLEGVIGVGIIKH